MGSDKAFLKLGGKPLVEHAVTKLRRVCDEVSILGNDPRLEQYAPIVPDIHPGCGPLGGMEAALLDPHSWHEWNLFIPVDVPFLPTAYLQGWVRYGLPSAEKMGAFVWMFTVEGVPQPTVALIHRAVGPFLTESIECTEYKLLPALERAAGDLAERNGFLRGSGLWKIPYWSELTSRPGPRPKEGWRYTTPAQERESARWFANLNTPEEFAEAERHLDALDT